MISMSDVRCPMSDISRAASKQSRNDGLSLLVGESAVITHAKYDIGYRTLDIVNSLTGANS